MWPAVAKVLECEGLPKVDPMFGDRHWPRVRLFLDDLNGMDDDMTLYHAARPTETPFGDRTGGVRPRVRERGRR